MDAAIAEVPRLVRELYRVVAEFEQLFKDTNRKFTPDGHLVGSIGEVHAAHKYGLKLYDGSHPLHDAESEDGRKVQIKATQGKKVGLRGEPEHLVVIYIDKNGELTEIYNGPGKPAWDVSGAMQSNGQRHISRSRLEKLMKEAEKANWKKLPPVDKAPGSVPS
jgi:hypothetical protein